LIHQKSQTFFDKYKQIMKTYFSFMHKIRDIYTQKITRHVSNNKQKNFGTYFCYCSKKNTQTYFKKHV